MKPKRSDPLKWAAWGAVVGLAVTDVRADYGVWPITLISEFVGGAVGGAFLAGIAAFIRNRLFR